MSRLFRAVSTVVFAGLLTHCATSSGAGGQAGGDARLRFAWPEGLTVQVASVSTVTQDEQPPQSSRLSYQLRLEGKGEERRLITEQMKPEGEAGATPEGGQPPPTPTLVLGPKGELLRIEGVDPVVEQMARDAESQGIPKEQQAHITGLVRTALEQAARSRWEVLVGKWSGLELEPGEVIERKSEAMLPLFGSAASTLERVSLKERVPCTEGAKERRCVLLVLESSLEPEGLDKASDELVRTVKSVMKANSGLADAAIPEMTVMKLRLDSTLEFIAEPETLVPYRQRTVVNSHVLLQDPEGERKNFESQTERIDSFTPVAR